MSDQPQTFDEQQVAEAVQSLPEWSGDVHLLTRKVALDPAKVDSVMDEVHGIEGEMNHHAQIESVPSDDAETVLTFKVWTHTVGGVTDLDVQLAQRVEAVLGGAARRRSSVIGPEPVRAFAGLHRPASPLPPGRPRSGRGPVPPPARPQPRTTTSRTPSCCGSAVLIRRMGELARLHG